LEGKKNFILRRDAGQHYLFVSDVLQIDEERIILSLIKDITHIDNHRREQYFFFTRIGVIGLVFVALITWIMSKFVMKPIKDLSLTAQNIASGNYNDRAKVTGRDEIGLLAEQFNIMASEIEHKINQLKEESQRQQRFVDNLTHELRTPLTSIIGYAEFLQKVDYDPGLFKKSLSYIQSEGKRMLKLANTLMDMILLREKAYQLQKHRILPLLAEVKDIMSVKAGEKGIQLKIQGKDMEVVIDRDLIKGVVINLVDNAINASQKGKVVILGTEEVNGKQSIYVKDEGKGMEEWEIEKVKEPFYRVDKSRSRKEGGIGLGLTICNQIITGHGAELAITSKVGKGTTVKIIF
jgi:signal transduction histidine kinase